jgi:plastocyanin
MNLEVERSTGKENSMRAIARHAALALSASALIASPAAALANAGRGHLAGTHIVILQKMQFIPSTITIKRGESVTWVWRDGKISHNVTAPGFKSRTQSKGTFTVRFTHSGVFKYHCTIHQNMVGKVIVH